MTFSFGKSIGKFVVIVLSPVDVEEVITALKSNGYKCSEPKEYEPRPKCVQIQVSFENGKQTINKDDLITVLVHNGFKYRDSPPSKSVEIAVQKEPTSAEKTARKTDPS